MQRKPESLTNLEQMRIPTANSTRMMRMRKNTGTGNEGVVNAV